MNRRALIVTTLSIVVVTVALDQATKAWAESALGGGDVIEVLPTLEFDLTYNSGFSFGTGSDFGPWIGGLVFFMAGFLIHQIRVSETIGRARILSIILGGALGNLIDRLFRGDDGFLSGEVIDFIDVTWYAVFNVADIFVVCGCLAFVLHEIHLHRRALANPSTQGEGEPAPAAAVLTDIADGEGDG